MAEGWTWVNLQPTMLHMTKSWTVSRAVASRIRLYRERRGWTVRQLADRCKELGDPSFTTAVIGALERTQFETVARRRRISVDDLVGLADALEVTPAALLPDTPFPGVEDLDPAGIAAIREQLLELAQRLPARKEGGDAHL